MTTREIFAYSIGFLFGGLTFSQWEKPWITFATATFVLVMILVGRWVLTGQWKDNPTISKERLDQINKTLEERDQYLNNN